MTKIKIHDDVNQFLMSAKQVILYYKITDV